MKFNFTMQPRFDLVGNLQKTYFVSKIDGNFEIGNFDVFFVRISGMVFFFSSNCDLKLKLK